MNSFKWVYKATVLCAATAIILPAQTVTTLFSFGETDGANPFAALVQGLNGYLYGTTPYGGINCAATGGCGTVFKIAPNGAMTTLYSFCAFSQCPDGGTPFAALVQTANGDFYGTTATGGSSSFCVSSLNPSGCGTVFKMTPSGVLTTIYSFCSQSGCADGVQPMAGLVHATKGLFYGVTRNGGPSGLGTIFKITPGGTLTSLYNFCSGTECTDGDLPTAGLVQGANGNLYGTTATGGAHNGGTVYRITPSGSFTTLYSFCTQSGCADGSAPASGLVEAADGNFYGTTSTGGYNGGVQCSSVGCGTVFKMTTSGALTTLHQFTGVDGYYPYAALVQATDGNLYGATEFGGSSNFGTLFKIALNGSFTTIFNFASNAAPQAALVQHTDGNLYGTTSEGGTDLICSAGCGTIFGVTVGLGQFVRLQPTSGKVGQLVKIFGNNLNGATAVSFNGTPAIFRVASSTFIKTNVPTGASSGNVQVNTPNATLVSNVKFLVR